MTAIQESSVENSGKTAEHLFSKEQLIASERFAGRRDLLEILLEEGKRYSISEVEKKVEKFMKGKVR